MSTEASTEAPTGTGRQFDHHGGGRPRGIDAVPRSVSYAGRFGRMFRSLPPLATTDATLAALADSMGEAPSGAAGDNPDIPSGSTYLGQFVDHDITFDPVSSHDRLRDPDGLHNVRTPRFDLDSLYGAGRADDPFLYDEEDPAKLLVGRNAATLHEARRLTCWHHQWVVMDDYWPGRR